MKWPMGPGALVAAAFIGPGTVTACTLAGADFGFALAWALVFATFSTIVLQGMAARLGVVAQMGLGDALMDGTDQPVLKALIAGLILSALLVGNSAYEAGNLAGAALGLDAVLGSHEGWRQHVHVVLVAGFAGLALVTGRYRTLERLLVGLVLLMSLAFAASFVLVRPDLAALAQGLVPRVPEGGLLTVIALIGTTIVPYNLFLHAAAAKRRWSSGEPGDLRAAQRDVRISIGLGGLVSLFILATAAATLFESGLMVGSAADMAVSVEPLAGATAKYVIGAGLAAAGLTSAITAPMATGYAVVEILRRDPSSTYDGLFRGVALFVLGVGVLAAVSGIRPTQLIVFAQAANGLLLPMIAGFLLVAMNRRSLLGDHVNGTVENVLGLGVVAICLLLGARLVLRAMGVWP